MQKPTLGRIVLYTFTIADADRINRRREVRCIAGEPDLARGPSVAETIGTRLNDGTWPEGAQAHVGNRVGEGQQAPAMIVAVWGDEPTSAVNLKVELDGTDVYWAKSVVVNQAADGKPTPGQFDWPKVDRAPVGVSPANSKPFVEAQATPSETRPATVEEAADFAKAQQADKTPPAPPTAKAKASK